MNQVKLKDLIKEKKIVIPLYFLRISKKFNLSVQELTTLIYLYDKDQEIFNPETIAKDLDNDLMTIMQNISSLTDKGFLNIETIKNDSGMIEERLDLSSLFEMITIELISELNTKEEKNINIHNLIEQEFNRKLSTYEHEMIDDWENNDFDKELIREALKEASLNGVNNLRYMDKILIDWRKKGYKVPSDIKKENEEVKEKIEVYNCDWLNDDEEI